MLKTLKDWATGKVPVGVLRSGEWPKVRAEFLKKFPKCSSCSSKKKLEVHHMMPFHLDPKRELDESNLITLCHACHFFVGHLKNWKRFNATVLKDAAVWLTKFLNG